MWRDIGKCPNSDVAPTLRSALAGLKASATGQIRTAPDIAHERFVAPSWTPENATGVDRQFKGGKVPAKGSLTMTSEHSNAYPLTVTGPEEPKSC